MGLCSKKLTILNLTLTIPGFHLQFFLPSHEYQSSNPFSTKRFSSILTSTNPIILTSQSSKLSYSNPSSAISLPAFQQYLRPYYQPANLGIEPLFLGEKKSIPSSSETDMSLPSLSLNQPPITSPAQIQNTSSRHSLLLRLFPQQIPSPYFLTFYLTPPQYDPPAHSQIPIHIPLFFPNSKPPFYSPIRYQIRQLARLTS